jgi:hypothetical protein
MTRQAVLTGLPHLLNLVLQVSVRIPAHARDRIFASAATSEIYLLDRPFAWPRKPGAVIGGTTANAPGTQAAACVPQIQEHALGHGAVKMLNSGGSTAASRPAQIQIRGTLVMMVMYVPQMI